MGVGDDGSAGGGAGLYADDEARARALRYSRTLSRLSPTSWTVSLIERPSPAASTIRARVTTCCPLLCRRTHDEPAEATIRLHVRCLDCELEVQYRSEAIVAVTISRAA